MSDLPRNQSDNRSVPMQSNHPHVFVAVPNEWDECEICGLDVNAEVHNIDITITEHGVTERLKFCRHCEQWLPVSEFYRNRSKGDGRASYCKKGQNESTSKARRARRRAERTARTRGE